jgi:hypothetical protein
MMSSKHISLDTLRLVDISLFMLLIITKALLRGITCYQSVPLLRTYNFLQRLQERVKGMPASAGIA